MNNPKQHIPKAFTLLEMVITMMIISIVMGSAFFAFSTNVSNPLTSLAPEIETLSTKAVQASVSKNQTQYIILTSSKIVHTTLPQLPDEDSPQSLINQINVPSGVIINYRKSNQDDWTTVSDRTDPIIWVISRSGISEQIELQLQFEDSAYEMSFDPITGNMNEEDEIDSN